MANVGRVKIDSDGVYIELKSVHYTKPQNLLFCDGLDHNQMSSFASGGDKSTPADLLRSLQDTRLSVGEGLRQVEMSLFAGTEAIRSDRVEQLDSESDEDENEEDSEGGSEEEGVSDDDYDYDDGDDESFVHVNDTATTEADKGSRPRPLALPAGEFGQAQAQGEADRSATRWKEGMRQRAESAFAARSSNTRAGGRSAVYLSQLVYGDSVSHTSNDDEPPSDDDNDDLFATAKSSVLESYRSNNTVDSSRFSARRPAYDSDVKALCASLITSLRIRFVTGGAMAWGVDGKDSVGLQSDGVDGADSGSEYGEFEDLQVTADDKNALNDENDEDDDEEGQGGSDDSDDESEASADSEAANDVIDRELRDGYASRKAAAREKTDGEQEGQVSTELGHSAIEIP